MNRDLAGDSAGAGGGAGRTFGSASDRLDYDYSEALERLRRISADYEASRNNPFEVFWLMLAGAAMMVVFAALTVLAFWCFGLLKV